MREKDGHGKAEECQKATANSHIQQHQVGNFHAETLGGHAFYPSRGYRCRTNPSKAPLMEREGKGASWEGEMRLGVVNAVSSICEVAVETAVRCSGSRAALNNRRRWAGKGAVDVSIPKFPPWSPLPPLFPSDL